MIRRPPRSTHCISSAASDVYKRQLEKDKLLLEDGAEIITQRGREMKGYVHIQSPNFESDQELEFWITKCLEFNPKAKSKKKKK